MTNTSEFTADEIVRIVTPFIDYHKGACPLSVFAKHPRETLEKVGKAGVPIVLTLNGEKVAIVCTPSTYLELEARRTQLESLLLQDAAKFPRVGRAPGRDVARELARCQKQILSLEDDLARQDEFAALTEERRREIQKELQTHAEQRQRLESELDQRPNE